MGRCQKSDRRALLRGVAGLALPAAIGLIAGSASAQSGRLMAPMSDSKTITRRRGARYADFAARTGTVIFAPIGGVFGSHVNGDAVVASVVTDGSPFGFAEPVLASVFPAEDLRVAGESRIEAGAVIGVLGPMTPDLRRLFSSDYDLGILPADYSILRLHMFAGMRQLRPLEFLG